MKNRLLYWGAVALLIALGSWIVLVPEPNPHLERAQQLESQLDEPSGRELTREERGELIREMQQEIDWLAPEQRQAFDARMRERFQRRQQREMDEFFALSEPERLAELDRRIDDMEARRQQWQSRGGAPSGSFGGRPSGSPGGSAASLHVNAGGGRSGEPSNVSPDAVNSRRQDRLEESTAPQRAQRAEYFRLLDERRKERGLPSFGGPRRA